MVSNRVGPRVERIGRTHNCGLSCNSAAPNTSATMRDHPSRRNGSSRSSRFATVRRVSCRNWATAADKYGIESFPAHEAVPFARESNKSEATWASSSLRQMWRESASPSASWRRRFEMSRLELPASRSGRYNGAAKAYVIRHRSCVQARDGQTVRFWVGLEQKRGGPRRTEVGDLSAARCELEPVRNLCRKWKPSEPRGHAHAVELVQKFPEIDDWEIDVRHVCSRLTPVEPEIKELGAERAREVVLDERVLARDRRRRDGRRRRRRGGGESCGRSRDDAAVAFPRCLDILP